MSFANESPPETSIRYDGWRVVAVCFIAAIFAWGLGFYGQGLYLAELHRSKGWSTSLMSTATTLYYLSGSGLVIWDSGSPVPPLANVPPRAGADPHEDPRRSPLAQQQKSDFLKADGTITDVCGNDPCTAPPT